MSSLSYAINTFNANLAKRKIRPTIKKKNGKTKIPEFNRNKVCIQRTLLAQISKSGNLKLLTLYLKLKRQYRSGHFHSYSTKPSWYPGKPQTYRNHINKMIQLGWIEKDADRSGFSLISLNRLYSLYSILIETKVNKNYSMKASLYDNKSYQELLSDLQLAVVTVNYQQQIHNISTKRVAYANIICDKTKKKTIHLVKTQIYNNVASVAHLHLANKTTLSSKGMGRLFGKSSYTGQKIFNELIEQNHIIRNIELKFVSHDINLSQYDLNYKIPFSCFVKDKKLFRKNTSFMLTSFVKDTNSYECKSSFTSNNIIKDQREFRIQKKLLTEELYKTIDLAQQLILEEEIARVKRQLKKANKLRQSLNTKSIIKPIIDISSNPSSIKSSYIYPKKTIITKE